MSKETITYGSQGKIEAKPLPKLKAVKNKPPKPDVCLKSKDILDSLHRLYSVSRMAHQDASWHEERKKDFETVKKAVK